MTVFSATGSSLVIVNDLHVFWSGFWSGGSFGERPCVGDGAYEKCMIACGQVEIDWGQAGRSSYDRTHAEL
jgi:hypothetical protein